MDDLVVMGKRKKFNSFVCLFVCFLNQNRSWRLVKVMQK